MAFIEFHNITKRFAGVVALDDVSLSVERGQCHGLMGENGAGKSTLGKVLAGIHKRDAGTVLIDGKEVSINSPADAQREGIGMVHQELAFCPDLSVAENLSMGQYPKRFGVLVDGAEMVRKAELLLSQIGVQLDVRQPMRTLSTAQEQLVQIASAVGLNARILVFDEPTSSLSHPEALSLFKLIEHLKAKGKTMIYVSHRMPELFRLCDQISVLRDGKYVGTLDRKDANQDSLVRMMIGRSVQEYFPTHMAGKVGKTLLKVRNLNSPGKFKDVSFDVRVGEIVGFAGLVGAGRSEVAKAIFGLDPDATGTVEFDDAPLPLGSIRTAMARGIGLVPEDRKRQGLILMMSGRRNFSMAMLDRLKHFGLLDHKTERRQAEDYFEKLRVKTPSIETPVAGLSGGNQQKVALAKWLGRSGKLLIVDEPTRGVDIGAKAAIHELVDNLAQSGLGVILISSELPEVINLSTRILIMRDGTLRGEVPREQATQENVLRLMAGVEPEPVAASAN